VSRQRSHKYHWREILRSGRSIRFTATEIKELRALGIDIGGAKSPADFAAALEPWLQALADVRPDLLDPIVSEIAAARGIRLLRDSRASESE
jgi:hypothetical protein